MELKIFQSIAQGQAYVTQITPKSWSRSIRLIGGPWIGKLSIVASQARLFEIFSNWLGYHLEEHTGTKTWEGMIYEMEYTLGGITRRISLDDVANAIKTTYIDETDTSTETSFQTLTKSIEWFGRKEEIVTADQTPAAAAVELANTELTKHGWEIPKPVNINSRYAPPTLKILVCGYSFTANWRFVTAADDATGNVDAWISNIISTDLEFINSGTINTNTVQIKRTCPTPTRCWNLLMDLIDLGDSAYAPWRIFLDIDRNLTYEQLSTEIQGYLKNGEFHTSEDALVSAYFSVNPWSLQPGIYRDISGYNSNKPNMWLSDSRDVLVTGIEVDINGIVKPTL